MKLLLLMLVSLNAFSADRSVFISSSLAANATVNSDSAAIPVGKKLYIKKIGMTDTSVNDRPSVIRVFWNANLVREYAVTAGTMEFPVELTLVGNGTRFLRIQRQNLEAVPKVVSVWVEARDLEVRN